jgi:hypothetical protein
VSLVTCPSCGSALVVEPVVQRAELVRVDHTLSVSFETVMVKHVCPPTPPDVERVLTWDGQLLRGIESLTQLDTAPDDRTGAAARPPTPPDPFKDPPDHSWLGRELPP